MSDHTPKSTAEIPLVKRRYRFVKVALSLMVLHLAITAQLIPIIGMYAAIYASFPPIILMEDCAKSMR